MKALIFAACAALSLVACGGGGGSNGPIPVINPTTAPTKAPTTTATLKGGFGSSNASTQSTARHALSRVMPMDTTLNGTLQPFIDFVVCNQCPGGNTAVQAEAYLDNSNGGVLPATIPAVTWGLTETVGTNQTLPVGVPQALPTPNPSATPGQFGISQEQVSIPTVAAQWNVTINAPGFQQVNLQVSSYNGFGLSNEAAGSGSNNFDFAAGVIIDATGNVINVDQNSANGPQTPDIAIDAQGNITCNLGGNTEMPSANPAPNLSQLPTTPDTLPSTPYTITASMAGAAVECNTSGGHVIKFKAAVSIGVPDTRLYYFGYQVATNGTFAY